MKKTNKKQRGITLIALIITIIVMLILVGVSVSIALNNGLFKATQNAARETEAEKGKEKDISEGKETIDETTYSSIESYVTGKAEIPKDLKVGDYISNYDPTPVYNNGTNYKVSGSLSGTGTDQTFTEDTTLGWRVLSIDETTGKVELIADKATSTKLTLKGATAWNNNPEKIINDTCKAIYSKAGVGEARSINVEDVNKISGYKPTTYEGYGSTYPAGEMFDIRFPLEYLKEKGITESTFTDADKTNGYAENSIIRVEDTWYSYEPEEQTGYTAPGGLINIGKNYWLASRCVFAKFSGARLGMYYMSLYGGVSFDYMFYSDAGTFDPGYALRPVVSLESSVQLEKDETATTADKTYWKIK